MSDYTKKLASIKADIEIIQDAIFFELHTINKEITHLKAENEKLKQKQLRVINYSKDKLDQMWAATVVSVLLDCDFRDAKEVVKKWEDMKDDY